MQIAYKKEKNQENCVCKLLSLLLSNQNLIITHILNLPIKDVTIRVQTRTIFY